MRLFDPRSEVTVEPDGWAWLRPHRASLRLHQLLAWLLLALALAVAAGGVAFLDLLPGVVLAVAGVVVAIIIMRGATRSAYTRAGTSSLGLLIQLGPRVVQLGWPAVATVRAEPDGRRRRLVVVTDQGPTHRSGATFEGEAITAWLEHATAHAQQSGRSVRLHDDGFDVTR